MLQQQFSRRRWTVAGLALCAVMPWACLVWAQAPATQPPEDSEFFTIVVMPDTQYYTEITRKNETYFKGQTRWIVENRAQEHIAFVSHLGDIQQDGNFLRLDRQPDPEQAEIVAHADPANPPRNELQWQRASEAMKILDDADMPYVAVAGNHDFEHWNKIYNPVMYLQYFGPQRFESKSWYGGFSPASTKQPAGINSYQYFSGGGQKFLSIGLRFAPDAEDLKWAQGVIDANPGLPTILSTHAYVTNKGIDKDRRNIWEQLVRKNPQIFMTLNGHENGHNLVIEKDDAGLEVYEMLVDFQDWGVPGYDNGGGFMRLLRFEPEKSRIEVRTYSPVTKTFMADPKDQFTLRINFRERFAARPHATTQPTTEPTMAR